MGNDTYIPPLITAHADWATASEAIGQNTFWRHTNNEAATDFASIAAAPRTLIVGEPGIGKSLLLEQLNAWLRASGFEARTILLRAHDCVAQIEQVQQDARNDAHKAILLDGFDELPAKSVTDVVNRLAELRQAGQNTKIIVSSRWAYVRRHAQPFADYRIVVVHPFAIVQVYKYLESAGISQQEAEKLLESLAFGHREILLQTPRYLGYLKSFIADHGIGDASRISRNDLFDYFIYRKLELEEDKDNSERRALTKRLLEKLALTMEIYQTNVVTEDELMTFLDELDSDLKRAALAQINLASLYDASLLRVTDIEEQHIQFENTEFQEYLAAKEITRFPDPNRAAFGFAVEPNTGEIRPSWFNTLTFLVDFDPSLLESFVEFSGLFHEHYKLIDETFFTFLSRIDSSKIPAALRRKLFRGIVDYFSKVRQWMPGAVATKLASLYDESLEEYLRTLVTLKGSEGGDRRAVTLANVAHLIGRLLEETQLSEKDAWTKRLLAYACDVNEHPVVRRDAVAALAQTRDTSVIAQLASTPRHDELLSRAVIDACITLDPDDPITVSLVFDGVSNNDVTARRGLYRLQSPRSLRALLERVINDSEFCEGLLQGTSIFNDRDGAIGELTARCLDADLRPLGKDAVAALLVCKPGHNYQRASLLNGLWKALAASDVDFAGDLVRCIVKHENGKAALFFARSLFAEALEAKDLRSFMEAMGDTGDSDGAFQVMQTIRTSGRADAADLYEDGRKYLPTTYARHEAAEQLQQVPSSRPIPDVVERFRDLLEPEPGKFRTDVFRFYNEHHAELDPLAANHRNRLTDLLLKTVFKFEDPGRHGLTIVENMQGGRSFTTSSAVSLFEEAAETARLLHVDVSPYRAAILSLIPFAYPDELQTIFALVPRLERGELDHVIQVYLRRDSDLWRHRPQSLLDAARHYQVVEAVPVARAFVNDRDIDEAVREEAITVSESLRSDADFLEDVFNRYQSTQGDERALAEVANGLLITTFQQPAAVRWRLAQLASRVVPVAMPSRRRARPLTAVETEVIFEKAFALPLATLSSRSFEDEFIALLEVGLQAWARGEAYQRYAEYLWELVFTYFSNLRTARSYEPLQRLESAIRSFQHRAGANWLARRMLPLRRTYLSELGRPRGISDAVRIFNEARRWTTKAIASSDDLFHHLRDAIDTDIRRWIEGEGAYRLLVIERKVRGARYEHEALVQKTVKTQIENVLLRRGFQIDVAREEQLLDGKRVDFVVRYGFTGPILIEVKLTSNSDLKGKKLGQSASFLSMRRYMSGYGAAHGIFLVIKNTAVRNAATIVSTFEQIPRVHVQLISCNAEPE